jgi:putative Mn2+ efflux pump MntP
MGWIDIILLSFALAADATSVGAAVGVRYNGPHQLFRLSFHFGLFQALFPLLGVLFGRILFTYVGDWDHWIAFGILVVLGARMVIGALRKVQDSDLDLTRDPTKGLSLIGLSTAVSIDAFGVGVSVAAASVPLWQSVAVIGVVTALATMFAMLAASWLACYIGKRAELVAGLVLIGIGAQILVEGIAAAV